MTLSLILIAGLTFFILALIMFVKEATRSDDPEITFEDLKEAAGKGQTVTLTPDQCSHLYNRYRRANYDKYRIK